MRATKSEHEVVVVGAGPTGLMLAGELALAGIDVAIVERRPTQDLIGWRAGGMHARTVEVMEERGIAERFVAQGQKHPSFAFHNTPLDLSSLPSRHNYVLGLRQALIERTLAEWIDELRVPVYRLHEVGSLEQDEAGVSIALAEGGRLRAQYLVGCDGGRSQVRKAAGIDFPGWDPTTSWLIAEVQTTTEPKLGFHQDAYGIHAIGKAEAADTFRMVLTERHLRLDGDPTMRDVSQALVASYATDYGIHSATWLSRFTDMTRQAARYRDRRVLLAGDAAHVHPPIGGQGLNLGVQDAANLGWKLAAVVRRTAPDKLLDSYHAERHAVAARVLKHTMALVALRRTDDRSKALSDVASELLGLAEPRRQLAAEIAGLNIRYDFGAADNSHTLLGRRMPDIELSTPRGPSRASALLHGAKPCLLNLGEPGSLDIMAWADRVPAIEARFAGSWELPAVGPVAAPHAVLVRPDGYVAWVGEGGDAGLADALTTWFGPPR